MADTTQGCRADIGYFTIFATATAGRTCSKQSIVGRATTATAYSLDGVVGVVPVNRYRPGVAGAGRGQKDDRHWVAVTIVTASQIAGSPSGIPRRRWPVERHQNAIHLDYVVIPWVRRSAAPL
jgi:hypothetical protein